MPDELDDFLQRAAQRRQARRPRPEIEILDPVEIVDAQAVPLADEVSDHIDTSRFDERSARVAQRTQHLGDGVQSDQVMESHLHQVFDHKLGQLAHSAQLQPEKPPAKKLKRAHSLLDELRTPAGVRRALILSEILARPEHRW